MWRINNLEHFGDDPLNSLDAELIFLFFIRFC